MKKLPLIALAACLSVESQAQDSLQTAFIDSLESTLHYQYGEIIFENGIGTLTVPSGLRYLDPEQTTYVLQELWGDPEGSGTLGMLVPESTSLLADSSWAFIITFDTIGYVQDHDAHEIDYNRLLKEMQEDTGTAGRSGSKSEHEPLTLIGWASKPYYDPDRKVLHWAKEIKPGNSPVSILNCHIRILGRKGVVVLNAVSTMRELPEVQKSMNAILSSFRYADGFQYNDFDSRTDRVAAHTLDELVAGKTLAKAGIFELFSKYAKVIVLVLAASGIGLWYWHRRKPGLPR